jgi:hypothetical protein
MVTTSFAAGVQLSGNNWKLKVARDKGESVS